MTLDVDLSINNVHGSENIIVNVTSPTKFFIVHAIKYSTITGQIRNDKKEIIKLKRQFEVVSNQFNVMELDDKIPVGIYYVEYKFSYYLSTKSLKGFYKSTYRTKAGMER